MVTNPSKERLIRNEKILRAQNTATSKGIKKYFHNNAAIKNAPVSFVCECSRLDCKEYITASINTYEKLHQRKDYFTIRHGHGMPSIEKLVAEEEDFDVVEKFALSSQ
jgi:hypothetical protein